MAFPYAVLIYPEDPVARAVSEFWGVPEATGSHADGASIRRLPNGAALIRRPGVHIHDRRLDSDLPAAVRTPAIPLVFPSIHRSESARPALTVHPLGNLASRADYGGEPGRLVPTAPRLMTDALRKLYELPRPSDYSVSFEATHHGPFVRSPAFFVEIGTGSGGAPPQELARALAGALLELTEDDRDVVALGIGGGHYAPHFSDLARDRRVAFGHLISRHFAETLSREMARTAWDATPGAGGVVYHRADDERTFGRLGLGPALATGSMPPRPTRCASSPAAGT